MHSTLVLLAFIGVAAASLQAHDWCHDDTAKAFVTLSANPQATAICSKFQTVNTQTRWSYIKVTSPSTQLKSTTLPASHKTVTTTPTAGATVTTTLPPFITHTAATKTTWGTTTPTITLTVRPTITVHISKRDADPAPAAATPTAVAKLLEASSDLQRAICWCWGKTAIQTTITAKTTITYRPVEFRTKTITPAAITDVVLGSAQAGVVTLTTIADDLRVTATVTSYWPVYTITKTVTAEAVTKTTA
ncbi:hypothetical protein LTS18_003604 [Coniosporium uncinatum]|uniref:Uncharacterized protein n=1 Tax=Coniosporium uncinatum TaxID=93489 RepID=A0ACC3DCI4_9PEZI|nr:hypothetical protein LTS18_003604 [Coniosporium uncinatum]